MVSQLATDQILNSDLMSYATRTGNTELTDRLAALGQPPYADMYGYALILEYYDELAGYDQTEYFQTHRPSGIDGTGVPEYGPLDKINKEKALADTAAVLYPQLQQLDFRTQIPELLIPVYLVQGSHELPARNVIAREWFQTLRAPVKEWITFEDSGHIPQFEEYPRFHALLVDIVHQVSGNP